jgi:hypothetical protein
MRAPNDEDVTFAGQMPVYGASAFATNSISVSTKANCSGSPTSYMWQVSITIVYALLPPPSAGELSASSVDAGSAISIDLTNAQMASCTHTLYWSIGAYNSTQNLAQGVDTSEFTIPLAWLKAMPSSSSGAASVKVTTYLSGQSLGYNTYTFYITAGSAIIPSISSFTATRIDGDVPSGWDIYVQGKSKVRLQVSASSVYGATISVYSIYGDGYTGSVNDYTTGFINGSGTITYTVGVIDSRGKTATTTVQITVYSYAAPSVSPTSVYRCLVDGTISGAGTYAKAKGTVAVSSCNSNNALVSYAMYFKEVVQPDESYALIEDEAASNTYYVFGAGAIDQAKSYNVKFVLTDSLGENTVVIVLSAARFIIFLRDGGTGIAFGMESSQANAFEVSADWPVYFGGVQMLPPLVFTFTLVAASWAGSGPYTQSVNVTGMLAAYVPISDIVLSTTTATAMAQLESYKFLLNGNITTANGSISAICYEDKPTVNLPIRMVVNR